MSEKRQDLLARAKAKRVYELRKQGVSVRETAEIVGCEKAQVRKYELMGERLQGAQL